MTPQKLVVHDADGARRARRLFLRASKNRSGKRQRDVAAADQSQADDEAKKTQQHESASKKSRPAQPYERAGIIAKAAANCVRGAGNRQNATARAKERGDGRLWHCPSLPVTSNGACPHEAFSEGTFIELVRAVASGTTLALSPADWATDHVTRKS